jgi:hypothetical protein
MPATPKESKKFMMLLIEKKTLPFGEALSIFADKQGKFNRDNVAVVLNMLSAENCFSVLNKKGDEVWIDNVIFDSPEDYTLRFNSIAGFETSVASGFSDWIDPNNVNEIAPNYVWATMQRREQLRIAGDQQDAPELAERIRAFTHQFAFHLVTGQHERIAGLFSTRAAKGQTLETLLTRIANLEKEFGPFDYFDHIEVISVFNGDVADVTASAHMKLPKGVHRNEQRGLSRFQIISVRTPNGMFIHEYTVSLSIIEEDGFLCVCDAKAYSGY